VRLVPCLPTPSLLGALGAGPLLGALRHAFEHPGLATRSCAVDAFVQMYNVLGDALRPFLVDFSPRLLKLITIYVSRRQRTGGEGGSWAATGGQSSTSPAVRTLFVR
ncbi:unnamed protein product, partial [Discosporangium mesarthrocarpum]